MKTIGMVIKLPVEMLRRILDGENLRLTITATQEPARRTSRTKKRNNAAASR